MCSRDFKIKLGTYNGKFDKQWIFNKKKNVQCGLVEVQCRIFRREQWRCVCANATLTLNKGLAQHLELVSASQSLGSRFKTRQDPGSLTYSKIAASAVLMSGIFRGFGISGFGIGEKGFVSKQLHSSRLHCSDVEWGAFAYHGIWESGQMLGVHSHPSDGVVKWRSREQDQRFHTPASLSSEHLSKREGMK